MTAYIANAINVLQACIYKSVKVSLFLKSFVATGIVYFNIIMLFCKGTRYLKVKTGNSILDFTIRGAIRDSENGPVFTDL